MNAVIWLAIVVVLIIVELITMGLTTIWFAGGALIACITALFGAGILIQVLVFLLVSAILLYFTRPLAIQYMNQKRTKTNVDSWIGQEVVVLETIDNLKAQGKIQLNGIEWTARAEDNGIIIPEGTIVEVCKIEGVKAIVRKRGNEV